MTSTISNANNDSHSDTSTNCGSEALALTQTTVTGTATDAATTVLDTSTIGVVGKLPATTTLVSVPMDKNNTVDIIPIDNHDNDNGTTTSTPQPQPSLPLPLALSSLSSSSKDPMWISPVYRLSATRQRYGGSPNNSTRTNTNHHNNDSNRCNDNDDNGGYIGNEKRGRFLIIVMAFAFCFLFTAFGPIQSLMTTFFPQYGKVSLSVLYFTYAIGTIPSPAIVRNIGPGLACCIGCIGYVLWMGNSVIQQSWPTVIVSAMLVGFGASLLWTSNGVLITENSSATARGTNAGTFLAIYRCSGLIGNGLLTAMVNANYGNSTICSVFAAIGAVGLLGLFIQWLLLKSGGGMKGRERCFDNVYLRFFFPPPSSVPTPTPATATATAHASSINDNTTDTTASLSSINVASTLSTLCSITPPSSSRVYDIGTNYDEKAVGDAATSKASQLSSPIDSASLAPPTPECLPSCSSTSATATPAATTTTVAVTMPMMGSLSMISDAIGMAVSSASLVTSEKPPRLMTPRQRAIAVVRIIFHYDMRHILLPCMAIFGLTQGWMTGSFPLLVGKQRLGPIMIVHGVAITCSSYLLGRLYDRTARKNLLVFATLAAFILSLILTYWAIQLESGSDGQVALWYIIVVLYGTNLGGFEAFVFSTFGRLFADRADIAFASRSVVQSLTQAVSYLVLPEIPNITTRLSLVFTLDVLCVLYFLTWKPPSSMRHHDNGTNATTTTATTDMAITMVNMGGNGNGDIASKQGPTILVESNNDTTIVTSPYTPTLPSSSSSS